MAVPITLWQSLEFFRQTKSMKAQITAITNYHLLCIFFIATKFTSKIFVCFVFTAPEFVCICVQLAACSRVKCTDIVVSFFTLFLLAAESTARLLTERALQYARALNLLFEVNKVVTCTQIDLWAPQCALQVKMASSTFQAYLQRLWSVHSTRFFLGFQVVALELTKFTFYYFASLVQWLVYCYKLRIFSHASRRH